MKKNFKLALVLASMISLFSCSNKVNNPEYNDYFQKVSSIINDFTNSNNKAKKQIFKRMLMLVTYHILPLFPFNCRF